VKEKQFYRLLDHTADTGIEVTGNTKEALFENAALALADLMAEGEGEGTDDPEEITLTGVDLPDLMVNWLRELLYQWTVEHRLIRKVHIHALSDRRIDTQVVFHTFNDDRPTTRHEIKAVTYHQAAVRETLDGWIAKVIFDL